MRVDNGRVTSSYSQIEKYLQCPYSWHMRYFLKMKSDIKHKALEYGLAIHETLEEYFHNQRMIELGEVERLYIDNFKHRQIPFDSPEEELEYYFDGLKCVERLSEPVSFAEQLMVDQNNEIIGIEEPFEVKIKLPKFKIMYLDDNWIAQEHEDDTVHIVGFIDLVLRTSEGIVLIDHKSGKKKFPKKKLNENLQFPIYAMAIKEKYGELPFGCHYNFTKLGESQSVSITPNRIYDAHDKIVGVFGQMLGTKHKAVPTPLCYWCDYGKHRMNECKFSSNFVPKPK